MLQFYKMSNIGIGPNLSKARLILRRLIDYIYVSACRQQTRSFNNIISLIKSLILMMNQCLAYKKYKNDKISHLFRVLQKEQRHFRLENKAVLIHFTISMFNEFKSRFFHQMIQRTPKHDDDKLKKIQELRIKAKSQKIMILKDDKIFTKSVNLQNEQKYRTRAQFENTEKYLLNQITFFEELSIQADPHFQMHLFRQPFYASLAIQLNVPDANIVANQYIPLKDMSAWQDSSKLYWDGSLEIYFTDIRSTDSTFSLEPYSSVQQFFNENCYFYAYLVTQYVIFPYFPRNNVVTSYFLPISLLYFCIKFELLTQGSYQAIFSKFEKYLQTYQKGALILILQLTLTMFCYIFAEIIIRS